MSRVVTVALFLLPLNVWSADTPAPTSEETIAALSRRVSALEAKSSGAQENPLIFMGFAALTWSARKDDPATGDGNAFALGMFDLFIRRDLGERIGFLGEVVLEGDEAGSTVVDLERCVLTYKPTDALEVDAGRYHSHFGWWNVNYHHGEWLQPSIGRPAGLEFEDGGGILPVHGIGISIEQRVEAPGADLNLVVEVNNGRGPLPDPPQMTGDSNGPKAVNLVIAMTPTHLSDLEFGANFYIDRISSSLGTPDFPAHNDLDEQIVGVYAAFLHGPLQAYVEAFAIRHHDRTNGITANSRTGYALLAWRFSQPRWGDITPYLRGDYLKVSDADTYFGSTDDRIDINLGSRWDMTSALAVKLQCTRSLYTFSSGDDASSAVTVQLCGTF